MSGVHFRADGTTVATNGHMMLSVKAERPTLEDWPCLPGVDTADLAGDVKPFTLPTETATKVFKAIRKSKIPVLESIALNVGETNRGPNARFHATDLETVDVIESRKVDGDFPNTDQVEARIREGGEFCFAVDLRLIEQLIKAAKETETARGRSTKDPIIAGFYIAPGDHNRADGTTEKKSTVDAMRIVIGDGDENELEAILMPCRA